MWTDPPNGRLNWRAAERSLVKSDPAMARLVRQVGPCRLAPRPDPFQTLVISIFNQQLSTKGAATLFDRFRGRFPGMRVTPRRVLAALDGGAACWDDETIRFCGISRQKRAYLVDLSERIVSRRLVLSKLAEMEDEAVIERLAQVKGIGVWTAQMFLMFTLCRPDVLPVLDLGIQESARRLYDLPERPKAATLTELAEPWRPWRTIACWYLWRGLEG